MASFARILKREVLEGRRHDNADADAPPVQAWEAPDLTDPAPRRARVIPREAARVLAAPFEVPVLAAAPSFPLPELPEESEEDEPRVSAEDLEQLRAQWAAEQEAAFERRLEAAVEQARSEGYEQGYRDAEEALRATVDADRAALREDMRRLREAWQSFIGQTEPLLAHLAVTMAQSILDAPLPPEVREVATRALSAAVDRIAGDPPLTIHVHPVDLLRLRETGLLQELSAEHPGLQWDSDESLREGDWIVESPAAMIRHLRDELLHEFQQRLGLSPLDDGSP
ncbi:MAG: hypothetical protein D6740_06830 [Alphaproteobacteria bacterium]|nr:MAG: hypothetical protein D6740_06830 [Alphaproteobacteria bacterium]